MKASTFSLYKKVHVNMIWKYNFIFEGLGGGRSNWWTETVVSKGQYLILKMKTRKREKNTKCLIPSPVETSAAGETEIGFLLFEVEKQKQQQHHQAATVWISWISSGRIWRTSKPKVWMKYETKDSTRKMTHNISIRKTTMR